MDGEDYPMSLVGEDVILVTRCVNQGIDSHLEAFTESSFIHNSPRRLECRVSPKDMPILLRRLDEIGSDAAMQLRSCILTTLEIEEV